jgi:hypothetical protein
MSGGLTTLTKRITATLNEFAPDLEKVRPIDRRIILSQFLTTDLGADFLNGKDPFLRSPPACTIRRPWAKTLSIGRSHKPPIRQRRIVAKNIRI